MNAIKLLLILTATLLASGCINPSPSYDYSEFRNSDPHSILVLPPINHSSEVIAPYSLMSQIAPSIAESGYYVFPVALVNQTFQNNGLTVTDDIHQVPIQKLHDIFGADSALYLTIEEYGTSYVVLSSETVVRVSAKLVDLRNEQVLWEGTAGASSAETRGNSSGGLVGMLIEAAVHQILETATDAGFGISAIASNRLLSSEVHNGLLYGPRSPKYGQPAPSEKVKK